MKDLTLDNLARVCRGTYCGSPEQKKYEVESIVTDSRQAQPGALFVAIPGQRVDGHRFIGDVIEKGAMAVLSEQDLGMQSYPYIKVESSLQAVKDIAAFYLMGLGIPVVGVTGSVGKTSTKEVISAVLAQRYCVLKTKGNFNNGLGLPLTVFRLRPEHQIAVLEMGISQFGEMSSLAQIARPDTCVITNIGPCHLEFLGSLDGVFKAKTEVFQYMDGNGRVVLNGDDTRLAAVEDVNGRKPLFFGLDSRSDIWADGLETHGLIGTRCRIHMEGETFQVRIPIPGRHMVYNALAATAVGRCYGLSIEEIQKGIESLEAIGGRMRMIRAGQLTVIDDCYNANPVSMKASLEVLKNAPGRKIAILGDMGELGSDGQRLHQETGACAAAAGLDLCICVGPLSRYMAEAARQEVPDLDVIYLENLEGLMDILPDLGTQEGTVLVKASHFMGFERVIAFFENNHPH